MRIIYQIFRFKEIIESEFLKIIDIKISDLCKYRDLKEVVKEWKDANPDKWKSWIPK